MVVISSWTWLVSMEYELIRGSPSVPGGISLSVRANGLHSGEQFPGVPRDDTTNKKKETQL